MAQNLKTEAIALPSLDELPQLTDAEQEFVRLIVQEGNSASDAFRKTHTTDHMKPSTVWWYASQLKGSPKVEAWRKAMMAYSLHSGILQADEFVRDMLALAERAEAAGNYGAAVQARDKAAKVAGLHIERMEIKHISEATDVLESIGRLLGPEARKSAELELGVGVTLQ